MDLTGTETQLAESVLEKTRHLLRKIAVLQGNVNHLARPANTQRKNHPARFRYCGRNIDQVNARQRFRPTG